VTETNELIDRIDTKLIGTKKHLQELRDEYDMHIKTYEAKVDSVNNAFSRVDLSIDKILRDMKDKFAEVQDQLEELEDDISSVKTQTKRDARKVQTEIEALKEAINEINAKLDE
jgi:DNA repair exonuclease SbcCD ATPase subunit